MSNVMPRTQFSHQIEEKSISMKNALYAKVYGDNASIHYVLQEDAGVPSYLDSLFLPLVLDSLMSTE